jgi:hypothetical protein
MGVIPQIPLGQARTLFECVVTGRWAHHLDELINVVAFVLVHDLDELSLCRTAARCGSDKNDYDY